jgi:KaiC/GvpD/RAD55 family RecA-like ATPase
MRSHPRSLITVRGQLEYVMSCLFEPDDIVEVRCFLRTAEGMQAKGSSFWLPTELPGHGDDLARLNADDDIEPCFGANPRRKVGGRTDEDVAAARCIFADFDHTDVDDVIEKISECGMPLPTLLINSGHGVHAYWRLTEPMTDMAKWRSIQAALAKCLGSDGAVKNPSRVMRLPGMMNLKASPAPCFVVEATPDRVYDIADITRIIPMSVENDAPRPRTNGHTRPVDVTDDQRIRRAAAYLERVPGAVEGEHGDLHTLKICGVIANGFDLTEDQAFCLLLSWNEKCSPPWSEPELRQKLRNAIKYNDKVRGWMLVDGQPHPARTADDNVNPGETLEPAATSPLDSVPSLPAMAWKSADQIVADDGYLCGLRHVTTGFRGLDRILAGNAAESGGLVAGGLYFVAGRTGSGKSTLLVNIARLMDLDGQVVLFFTLEDSLRVAMWRVHSAMAQVPSWEFLRGLDGRHGPARDAVSSTMDAISMMSIRMTDVRDLHQMTRLIEQHAATGGTVVIVDQISKIIVPEFTNHFERASAASEGLRRMAQEIDIPIIVASQVNRQASRDGGDIGINDLRDSGQLEQDAVGVLLVQERLSPPSCDGKIVDAAMLPIDVGKNRFGPVGERVELCWHTRIARIDDGLELAR